VTQPPFWQPALERAQIWRTLVGIVLISAGYFAATFGIFIAGAAALGTQPEALLSGGTPAGAAVFFATFIGFHITLLIILPLLHKRRYRSLFGPLMGMNWRQFRYGLYVTAGLGLVYFASMGVEQLILPEAKRPAISPATPLPTWVAWLIPALVLIFMQSLAEELVFRGYLLQQLRARFRSVWIWAILPSTLFGALHFDAGTYGINAWFYVLNTAVMGTIACFITLRTGNLGAAAGLHFANNAMMLLVGIQGDLDGFSLLAMAADPKSAYMTWSILFQTGLSTVVFVIWWRWMNTHHPIAKPATDH